jgi:prevent-host-death family protein
MRHAYSRIVTLFSSFRVPQGGMSDSKTRVASSQAMAGVGAEMKQVPLSLMRGNLSNYLRLAEKEGIVITRHGKPAGILIGFADEDDWFDYCLENDPRFLQRIASARANVRAGQGVRLEDIV